MAKGLNTQIVEAKATIVATLNDLKLPVAIIEMLMQEVSGYIHNEVLKALESEKEAPEE